MDAHITSTTPPYDVHVRRLHCVAPTCATSVQPPASNIARLSSVLQGEMKVGRICPNGAVSVAVQLVDDLGVFGVPGRWRGWSTGCSGVRELESMVVQQQRVIANRRIRLPSSNEAWVRIPRHRRAHRRWMRRGTGSPRSVGAVRSRAWTWDFSSTNSTTNPATSRILASSYGSVQNLNVSHRQNASGAVRTVGATRCAGLWFSVL